VPYSRYIEYQQLERQVADLERQVAELMACSQEDGALIDRLTTQLTKDHEEGVQLKQNVRHLSKHSLKNIREATAQQHHLRSELAKREQEVLILLERGQEMEERFK
jgi:peptidoglycan hydrolase CwlO-like protein